MARIDIGSAACIVSRIRLIRRDSKDEISPGSVDWDEGDERSKAGVAGTVGTWCIGEMLVLPSTAPPDALNRAPADRPLPGLVGWDGLLVVGFWGDGTVGTVGTGDGGGAGGVSGVMVARLGWLVVV